MGKGAMSIKSLLHNLVTSNLNISEDSLALKKVRLINFIILLAIPINTLFIYVNYITDQKIFALFNVLIVVVMGVTFVYLRRSEENIQRASHGVLLGVFLVHAPALLQGGIANSGFLWFFLFPLFAVFLTGRQQGLKWIGALLLTIVTTFVFQDYFSLPYEPIFLVFLCIVLCVETVYVLFSHNVQRRYEVLLAHKNQKLKHLTENLQEEVDKQLLLMRMKDQQLEQQSKMASVGEMMSFISHQWKQPISVIATMVQNAQLSIELDDKIQTDNAVLYEGILRQTELMNSTMRDFLKLANSNVRKEHFSLKHSLNLVISLVSSTFVAKNITLKIDVKDDVTLYGKENELIHTVMNVVNNARDVLVERNVANAEVNVFLRHMGNQALLTVCDNGGGVPEEILPKVFEPYFSTKLDSGGTGLGLYMTKKILEENFDASIDVVNSQDGACFRLFFQVK
jgi:signal transduction histidine kinase